LNRGARLSGVRMSVRETSGSWVMNFWISKRMLYRSKNVRTGCCYFCACSTWHRWKRLRNGRELLRCYGKPRGCRCTDRTNRVSEILKNSETAYLDSIGWVAAVEVEAWGWAVEPTGTFHLMSYSGSCRRPLTLLVNSSSRAEEAS